LRKLLGHRARVGTPETERVRRAAVERVHEWQRLRSEFEPFVPRAWQQPCRACGIEERGAAGAPGGHGQLRQGWNLSPLPVRSAPVKGPTYRPASEPHASARGRRGRRRGVIGTSWPRVASGPARCATRESTRAASSAEPGECRCGRGRRLFRALRRRGGAAGGGWWGAVSPCMETPRCWAPSRKVLGRVAHVHERPGGVSD